MGSCWKVLGVLVLCAMLAGAARAQTNPMGDYSPEVTPAITRSSEEQPEATEDGSGDPE